MNSDISKKIIAVCQENSKCEFTGKVRRINEELKGVDEANEIILVSQVNLGKVKNVYLPGELVMEDIYFAAEKPPITNAPSEAPLCHKFQVANLEEQLSKLKTKYVNLYDEKIIQNTDGSRSLMAKKKDESGKEFQYFYTTSPTVCSEYQKTHLVGDEPSNKIGVPTYVGTWAKSPELCRAVGDSVPMEIRKREIIFYESGCDFKSIVQSANTWTAKLECSGEGETWTKSIRITVSGNTLIYSEDKGKEERYIRCR